MVSLWGEYNRGPAVRRLFWSLGRAFTCFPNRQPLYHMANDHLFSLFAHQSISRLLALTYFLVHCLSFRSGNIATYMISTSSFLPSFKSFKFHSAHPSGFLSAFLPSPKGCQLLPPWLWRRHKRQETREHSLLLNLNPSLVSFSITWNIHCRQIVEI